MGRQGGENAIITMLVADHIYIHGATRAIAVSAAQSSQST
jgi:hypothetical protein